MPITSVRIDRIRAGDLLRALGGNRRADRILARLRLCRGGWVSTAELIDYTWGDDADGGPLHAASAVYVYVNRLRREGAAIESRVGRGSRGFRLQATEERAARCQSAIAPAEPAAAA